MATDERDGNKKSDWGVKKEKSRKLTKNKRCKERNGKVGINRRTNIKREDTKWTEDLSW